MQLHSYRTDCRLLFIFQLVIPQGFRSVHTAQRIKKFPHFLKFLLAFAISYLRVQKAAYSRPAVTQIRNIPLPGHVHTHD